MCALSGGIEEDEWPERDELVICTVKNVQNFGAFVVLEEYEGKEGLIHISEISHGWVRNIREFVREGQRLVCKVLSVDKQRGHIDLSLRRVSAEQRRAKIKEWKNEESAKKWLALAASQANVGEDERKQAEKKMRSAHGSLHNAFEEIVRRGKDVLRELGIPSDFADAIYNVAVANVRLPTVKISGFVELRCPLPNGVEVVKNALLEAENAAKANRKENERVNVECLYVGAPRYEIRVTAPDYKKAEAALREAAKTAIEIVKKSGGEGEFHRSA